MIFVNSSSTVNCTEECICTFIIIKSVCSCAGALLLTHCMCPYMYWAVTAMLIEIQILPSFKFTGYTTLKQLPKQQNINCSNNTTMPFLNCNCLHKSKIFAYTYIQNSRMYIVATTLPCFFWIATDSTNQRILYNNAKFFDLWRQLQFKKGTVVLLLQYIFCCRLSVLCIFDCSDGHVKCGENFFVYKQHWLSYKRRYLQDIQTWSMLSHCVQDALLLCIGSASIDVYHGYL